ncbi:EAL domain-containing protein [Paenibacillus sp. PFR10]|uniref:EAL domain-containing protein n=2 Tax=Paenibacillus TaxID=44249 RepID=A0ABU3RQC5_9BACL|nr:EAL domain-containing protein [Paenibacillus sp. PFR10]
MNDDASTQPADREMTDQELEYHITKIKNDILTLIVSDKSLTHIVRSIKEIGEKYIPAFCERAFNESVPDENLNREQLKLAETLKDLYNLSVERKQRDREIRSLAFYDPLTGLSNRRHFKDILREILQEHKVNAHRLGLIFIDLDHFKWVNDSLGHDAGDRLLIQMAERIIGTVGHGGVVARLGGDEFTVIVRRIDSADDACKLAEAIIDSFKSPMSIDNHDIRVTLSAGISIYPDHGTESSDLMRKADKAMYQAKQDGRNLYVLHQLSSNIEHDDARFLFKSQFEMALLNWQFFLEYQPRIDLNTGEIGSLEALVRWNHPVKGRVGPDQFISLAEETGFIIPLGEWVLQEACAQNKRWQEEGLPPVRVAVNVSVKQFKNPKFLYRLKEILQATNLKPCYLEIEITESSLMMEDRIIMHSLEVLREMGIYVSIDDFGTGYSSLNYLRSFIVDALKIDRSFIKDLPRNKALAKLIISMARKMKLHVIAEGVETYEQHSFLLNNGCHHAQGFLYSKPLPASVVQQLLDESCEL